MKNSLISDKIHADLTADPKKAEDYAKLLAQMCNHPGWKIMSECLESFREEVLKKIKTCTRDEFEGFQKTLTTADFCRQLPFDLIAELKARSESRGQPADEDGFGFVEPEQNQVKKPTSLNTNPNGQSPTPTAS